MGSNKCHKTERNRDSKKRHRSRSRSYSPNREKSEKHRHHKKHRRRERNNYDSDVEIVNVLPPPKISKYHPSTPPPPEISKQRSLPPTKGGASQAFLSIKETNKLRAKLGLKPLDVDNSVKGDSDKIKDDLGEFYHKPAPNVNKKLKTEKLKEKIGLQKQKRQIEGNLSKIKTLGECDSNEDATTWIDKFKDWQEEKKKAEEWAKMLDQLDEEFGIGKLVEEAFNYTRNTAYTEKDLKGLKVEHNVENFEEGKIVILTLKDQEVLEKNCDVLVNANMEDDKRYQKNVLNKKKKSGYDAYDKDNFDEFGMPKKIVLEKYDEEIEGEKKDAFSLGMIDTAEIKRDKADIVKQRITNKKLESLMLAEPKLASDYYNDEELTKFKKLKKKVRKLRTKKMLKAKDIIPEDNDCLRDLGSRRKKTAENKENDFLDVDDLAAPSKNLTSIKLEEEDKELDLQLALRKLQKLKGQPKTCLRSIVENIKQEVDVEDSQASNIVLNATAEYCRTLNDIPTYGLSGNREENGQELMDFEVNKIKVESPENEEEDDERGTWNTVKLGKGENHTTIKNGKMRMKKSMCDSLTPLSNDSKAELVTLEAAILDTEPSLGQGVGGALKLAMSKGYLQKEDSNRPSASRFAHLKAQNYSIEDKTYGDDDKFSRRDHFNGPTLDFKEKDGFNPNVKLDYIDDDGHVLSVKEAFRYLSHKFHGKRPEENETEKRITKNEQEVLNLLQAKQKKLNHFTAS